MIRYSSIKLKRMLLIFMLVRVIPVPLKVWMLVIMSLVIV